MEKWGGLIKLNMYWDRSVTKGWAVLVVINSNLHQEALFLKEFLLPTTLEKPIYRTIKGRFLFRIESSKVSPLYEVRQSLMADLPHYVLACLHTGKLAALAILVSGGIVLQILACALYNNWWPMLTVIMYVLLPMPLLFFAGSDGSALFSESDNSWVNATKFLTGASAVGSIAIPAILKHAGVIGWGALAMELSSFFVFVLAIMCFVGMTDEDNYYSVI